MEKTHWKKLTNPDYLGAYALDEGAEPVLTIKAVRKEMVTGADGKKEECIVAHWTNPGVKPMILNATNCKTITKLLRTPYIEEWAGHSIQIRVEQVRAFGDVVDALRVKPVLPTKGAAQKTAPVACADCGQVITGVGEYSAEMIVQIAQKRHGRPVCAECMKKLKAAAGSDQAETAQEEKEE